MIDVKTLKQINAKVELRDRISGILSDLNSQYRQTTIGIVMMFHGSELSAQATNDSVWFHRKLPSIEAELKERAIALLEREIAEIDVWLSERTVK